MSKDALHLVASVLLLLSLALVVIGLQGDADRLWQVGLGIVALAMAFALATRWVGGEKPDDEQENR